MIRKKNDEQFWTSKVVIVGGENPELPYFDVQGADQRLSHISERPEQEETKHHSVRKNRKTMRLRVNSHTSSEFGSLVQSIVNEKKRDGPILRQCEVFDPNTKETQSICVLNFGRKKCGMCSYGTVVYAIGGYGERADASPAQVKSSYSYISTIERFDWSLYDPNNAETWWKVVNVLHDAFVDCGAFVTGDKRILIFGGKDAMQEQVKITEIKDGYFGDKEEVCEKRDVGYLDQRISFPNMASFAVDEFSVLHGLNMYGQMITFGLN